MSDIAIRVQNLSKRYRIGLKEEMHDTMAGALVDFVKRPAHNLRRLRRLTRFGENGHGPGQEADDVLWALKDVSFEVQRGEVVGIIGRNGAGKSTLLKILSRITHPTSGRVELNGRVSSLLEVGTGFHPELTGRDNIYLNGTILGMRRAEIDRKFDEIVDFSGVEKFIDTPVKRYSSGMGVRLAFSVAAHLEPEILLVDEVLAVGDTEFQKKCLGKMNEVSTEGRTILFVSHNMSAIQRLCPRTLLLADGRVVADGPTEKATKLYFVNSVIDAHPQTTMDVTAVSRERKHSGRVQVVAVAYASDEPRFDHQPYTFGSLTFELTLMADRACSVGSLAVAIYDAHETRLVNADTLSLGETIALREGINRVRLQIKQLYLNPGGYTVGWWIADPLGKPFDYVVKGFEIRVVETAERGYGVRPRADGLVPCHFKVYKHDMDS